ncbi:MAG: DUF2946 family protein [Lautropia sp.]
MDEQVLRAMARWPDVPAVYGWLRLGPRAVWYLIDRGAPGFDPVRDADGSPITSPPIIAFINRNYQADAAGAWYWQNGPQRAYARLSLAPLCFRVIGDDGPLALLSHTGHVASRIDEWLVDRDGNLYALTDVGPGVVDDRDLARLDPRESADATVLALDMRDGHRVRVDLGTPHAPDAIAARWGYLREPAPPAH